MFAAAGALRDDFDVTVAGPSVPDASRLDRFGLPTDIRLRSMHPARFPVASVGVDLVLYLANGVPLPSFARRSLLILQFPFKPLTRWPLLRSAQRACLRRYDVLVYSEFVATWTRRRLEVDPAVLHPPATLAVTPPDLRAKEPVILGVGRFFDVKHAKRHDILIQAYLRLPESVRATWRLVLAGGVEQGPAGQHYLDRLRAMVGEADITFELDVPHERLQDLYDRAALFWHATGYGRADNQPERAEHFGLSTLEAMSHGVVPLVFADGGQTEVVEPGSGLLWRSIDELVAETIRLTGDEPARAALATAAIRRASDFPTAAFRRELRRRAGLAP
jgi:glycosyltransferase involved in cell wall biosynthesis